MIKRAHLRHFMALVDEGTITAAAARLNMTQPTLSVSLAELERQAGVSLFIRDRRRIRLTEAGHRMLAHARSIEREFRQAESLATDTPEIQPLRLGVLASLPTGFVAGLAASLSHGHAVMLMEGSDAELRHRLREGRIGAAITLLREGEGGAVSPELWEEPYGLLVSSRHRLAAHHAARPEELGGETMIARRSCELLAETSRFFTLRGVRPAFALRSAQEDRCLALVAAGAGITTGPASLAGGDVVAVALQGYDYRRRIGLMAAAGQSAEAILTAGRSAAAGLEAIARLS